MRLIEPIGLKQALAVSAILKDKKTIEQIIDEQPTIEERKRGKWIEDDDGWDGVIWRCSECDALFTLVDGTPEENEYYFCPHCGADMRRWMMKDLINGQPEQDIDHCGNCIHSADSLEICVLRTCKYAIGELIDCYEPKQLKQPWIPCSERLPEEDTEVLISYRYKEGEGDTDHVNIDITSYGTVCFGGREIHTLKEWRQPFDYFHANYEVIAWMPLPEPYKEVE